MNTETNGQNKETTNDKRSILVEWGLFSGCLLLTFLLIFFACINHELSEGAWGGRLGLEMFRIPPVYYFLALFGVALFVFQKYRELRNDSDTFQCEAAPKQFDFMTYKVDYALRALQACIYVFIAYLFFQQQPQSLNIFIDGASNATVKPEALTDADNSLSAGFALISILIGLFTRKAEKAIKPLGDRLQSMLSSLFNTEPDLLTEEDRDKKTTKQRQRYKQVRNRLLEQEERINALPDPPESSDPEEKKNLLSDAEGCNDLLREAGSALFKRKPVEAKSHLDSLVFLMDDMDVRLKKSLPEDR